MIKKLLVLCNHKVTEGNIYSLQQGIQGIRGKYVHLGTLSSEAFQEGSEIACSTYDSEMQVIRHSRHFQEGKNIQEQIVFSLCRKIIHGEKRANNYREQDVFVRCSNKLALPKYKINHGFDGSSQLL